MHSVQFPALKKDNFLIFVITNQAGIVRGFYQEVDVLKLHEQVDDLLFKLKELDLINFHFVLITQNMEKG